jgi:cytochrome oxidase Cu insertion factor (SCO1/SenC/PrrC family)
MSEQTENKAGNSNRIKVALVAIVFLAPVVTATSLKLTGWRPAQTSNYGELIVPARPLTDLKFKTPKGKRVAIKDYRHKWLMMTVVSGRCESFCEKNIYKMRQVHIATGKHQERVKRLLVLSDKASNKLKKWSQAYPDMAVASGPINAVRDLANQLQTKDGTVLGSLSRIYLIDPLGNFMMTYERNADPMGMHKDLGRLLRSSQVG